MTEQIKHKADVFAEKLIKQKMANHDVFVKEEVKKEIKEDKENGVSATLALNNSLNSTFYHILSNTSSLFYYNKSNILLSPYPTIVAKALSAITTKLNTPIK